MKLNTALKNRYIIYLERRYTPRHNKFQDNKSFLPLKIFSTSEEIKGKPNLVERKVGKKVERQ